MITVEALSKRFGELRAVDGIWFRVAKGELFGFLGPNGAGKTTTISMISGLLRPDSGTVFVGEYNLWESPKPAKRLLGLVPQEPAIYEEFNARENLFFWGGLYGLSRAELKQSSEEILQRVGLADRAKEPVSRYSGGMKRRLNLAIGLVHHPKVLLLDEPTVGIDPQARNNILEIIRDIAHEGTTIIFTYENPAQQVLPKVVRQGVSVLAAGLSGAAAVLQEPLVEIRQLIQANDFPPDAAVLGATAQSLQKMRNVRTYLLPPMIQFKTILAAEYEVSGTNAPAGTER